MKELALTPSVPGEVEAAHHDSRKKPFGTLSTLAVSMTLMATWEAFCATMGSGLVSGGPVSLVYGFIVSFIGSMCTATTLAELASMYPHAGGQYNVLSKIVPGKLKPILTWYCTYLTALGWLAFTASAPFLASQMIQGLLVLRYPDFVPHNWLASCIYWGMLLLAFVVNIWGHRILPALEKCVMYLHIIFFVIVFVVVLALPPERHSASFVFTTFINSTGWDSDAVAWFLGMLTSAYVMIGYDAAMHLSEEMPKPKVQVPRAMLGALGVNGLLGFALLLALLFGFGDLDAALNSSTGYPIIEVFFWITRKNAAAATALTCTVIFSATVATFGLLISSSRAVWAAARDQVLPFSRILSRTSERHDGLPIWAITVSTALLALLELLNIGSTTAFNAILSLTVIALYLSYLMPAIALLWLRLTAGDTIEWGPWRLSSLLGLLINAFAVLYTSIVSVFLLFPSIQPVTAKNMNYASVILGGVLIISTVHWLAYGRKYYQGPYQPEEEE